MGNEGGYSPPSPLPLLLFLAALLSLPVSCFVSSTGRAILFSDGAWVSREELRRDYRDNGVALTSEMIARFAAGREYEPVSE